jgi:uncharacterized protein YceH (UPF0502 family)
MEPDAVEIRVLRCLLEKERATPYVYPLSVDSLRRGCNQSRSHDPVVSYEEPEIEEALRRLAERGWTRKADEDRSRVVWSSMALSFATCGDPVKRRSATSSSSQRTGAVDSRTEWLEGEVVKLRAQLTAFLKALGE